MYRLCSNCKRKNCTMTNTGYCPMWTDSDEYDGLLYIVPKSRRQRRLEERLKKKKYANHK